MSRIASLEARFPALAAALPGWAVARVLIVLAVIAAEAFHYAGDHSLGHAFFGHERGLMAWDSDWYLRIARDGYDSLPVEGLRYFPLYPIGARLADRLLGGGETFFLLAIASVFAVVAGVLLYKLCMHEKDDARLARRSVWLLALAPPAFVMAMAYTEPLALTFAIGMFYAMRRGHWGWAALAGFGAGLVRPTGLLLLLPVAIEAWISVGTPTAKRVAVRAAALLSPVAGTAVYLWWSSVATGDAFLPLTVQQRSNARGDFQLPLVTFWDAARELVTDARVDQGLHLLWVAIFIVLVVQVFRHWPASYGAFAAVSLLQAVATSNLNSLERYGYGAFPVILAAASMVDTDKGERTLLIASALAMTGYATAAFVSGYVP